MHELPAEAQNSIARLCSRPGATHDDHALNTLYDRTGRRLGSILALSRSLLLAGLLAGLLTACSLPPLDGRTHSVALDASTAQRTTLGRAFAPRAQAHPDKSGIHYLADPHDAFAARVLLARAAEQTLDVQYYIWHGDVTGTLLLKELHAAADRGVRVRLLLDDNGTAGLDTELAALHTHPNIEVRLFNPFVVRTPKIIGFITDFSRVNRRMHNKSFTADNQATIIGGRNVGDEYFGAGTTLMFADLDVLAVGNVVGDVSADFDRYWASQSSYPVDRILPGANEAALAELKAAASALEQSTEAAEYIQAIKDSVFFTSLLEGNLAYEWADTRMVSDDPAKGLGLATTDAMLITQLRELLGRPNQSVDLISSYFVPTAAGVKTLVNMVQDGIRVRILTNSLNATDVAVVHAGYAKRRKALLEGGVVLYELRRMTPEPHRHESAGPFGSSGSSLHAKTFGVDYQRIFVGSFNFDPRSARLNTELGFVIESPNMARRIEALFDDGIPSTSYEVRLADSGQLYWIERRGNEQIIHETEPETGFFKRVFIRFVALLPIEWLL